MGQGGAAWRRLLLPGLMTAVMLATTLALGVWQVERLRWKTQILHDIDVAEAAPPIPLRSNPAPFTKVIVRGTMRRDLPALYGIEVRSTLAGPLQGGFLLNPLERPGADPIIVNRGWVQRDQVRPEPPTEAEVTGYVREPDSPASWLRPADDVAARQFYTFDPAAIGDALGLPRVAPFGLVAMGGASDRNAFPMPATALPRPPNNHLSYAITWFGLAAALLVIFATYARRALRGGAST